MFATLSFLALLGLGGWLEVEKGSTLKPVKKLQGRERILAMACGLWSLLLRPWGLAWLAGGRGMGSLCIQGALASLKGRGALVSPVNKV